MYALLRACAFPVNFPLHSSLGSSCPPKSSIGPARRGHVEVEVERSEQGVWSDESRSLKEQAQEVGSWSIPRIDRRERSTAPDDRVVHCCAVSGINRDLQTTMSIGGLTRTGLTKPIGRLIHGLGRGLCYSGSCRYSVPLHAWCLPNIPIVLRQLNAMA